MGDDSDIEEHYPWGGGRFGGCSWDETFSRDEAFARFRKAINELAN